MTTVTPRAGAAEQAPRLIPVTQRVEAMKEDLEALMRLAVNDAIEGKPRLSGRAIQELFPSIPADDRRRGDRNWLARIYGVAYTLAHTHFVGKQADVGDDT